ncbi:MAG: undecaprenyl-diphosphate phosphatase [Bacteroides sp.]|nr:undecaprenyl-diphosphate phosphatase [Bacteroidales bacterium]MCI7462246.1 undecaprenyl-diphosphate phosphatase [Bacteroides sp.]MDY2973481.1 undecaprenyl-diphosphate phosphatase [Candidatus Cryptobacteroides sp.]MED9900041.1 undecaprenyl-diphosphate phosphatase [Bacteroidales bacterium]HAW06458.1 UDP-diphosphatase [Rikenellaceae bacterium]
MSWLQALLLGIVQGLTEFLPVSSSGHLMIFRELLGVESEGFLDFTVTVHFATVLSTIVVFWSAIWKLLKGFFQFKYNDETDYVLKICVSMIPIAIVGLFFKDQVEGLFGENLFTVAVCLIITAILLFLSDQSGRFRSMSSSRSENTHRNGISYLQAAVVGLGQACAVAPGLSRSGTTIATGLICGVRRDVMAQFSFLMVLVPIIGEQALTIIKGIGETAAAPGVGFLPLLMGFIGAFGAGLFACKVMVELVKRAKLVWFSIYCLLAAFVILIFA